LETHINPELMQSVLEIATPVCRTAGDIDRELRRLRAYVTEVAREDNLRVGSAGTHPFSLFERQRITARDRYRHLIDQMQYVARRELIFGLHIHVAVDDPEKAIQVVNGLLAHLSQLLALSASSPFWRGEATGLSSTRQMVFVAFPRSGPPPRFRDYADYAEVVGQLEEPVMDLATGRRNRVPVAQLVRRTLRDLAPHARELGCDRELEGIREILSGGNGADRQLRVFNANRDIVEVVREIAEATEVAA